MATLLDEFRSITAALNDAGIEYAVCGGWAMAIHGLPRATIDIDLLIIGDDVDKAFAAARSCGYDIEGMPLSFDRGTFELRRISKIDAANHELITVDFLLVTDTYQDVWDRREDVVSDYGPMKVVSREGLAKMKLLASRPKDLFDLQMLADDDEAKH